MLTTNKAYEIDWKKLRETKVKVSPDSTVLAPEEFDVESLAVFLRDRELVFPFPVSLNGLKIYPETVSFQLSHGSLRVEVSDEKSLNLVRILHQFIFQSVDLLSPLFMIERNDFEPGSYSFFQGNISRITNDSIYIIDESWTLQELLVEEESFVKLQIGFLYSKFYEETAIGKFTKFCEGAKAYKSPPDKSLDKKVNIIIILLISILVAFISN